MGRPGVRPVVLDSGALIAIERNDRSVDLLLESRRRLHATIGVPATVLAQAWRPGIRHARLAAFMRLPDVHVETLDANDAKQIGLLCAATKTSDVVDAHVALLALRVDALVITSDPRDIERLAPSLAIHTC